MEATNKHFVVGVPLTCLIEFECVVGLVKARFPNNAKQISYDTAIKEQFN